MGSPQANAGGLGRSPIWRMPRTARLGGSGAGRWGPRKRTPGARGAAPSGGCRAQRGSAGVARGDGAQTDAATPHLNAGAAGRGSGAGRWGPRKRTPGVRGNAPSDCSAGAAGASRAQRGSAGVARGDGVPANGRRGFGATPHLIAAPAQPAQAAHSAARREWRGAMGSPQTDAGGSGQRPIGRPAQSAHSAALARGDGVPANAPGVRGNAPSGSAGAAGASRAQRGSAGVARGDGVPANGRRGFGATPHLIAAPAQPAQAAHSAARREWRGAMGSPQTDAGGSGQRPI